MTARVTRIGPRHNRWSARPASLGSVFQELEQLLQPLDAANVNRGGVGTYHPIDLYETDDAVVLEMAVPGVSTEELEVSIEGRQLTIRGRSEERLESEGRRYWLKGIARGEFRRIVNVPGGIDTNAIAATVDEGVLRVTMPKAAEVLARKIDVNASAGDRGGEPRRSIQASESRGA